MLLDVGRKHRLLMRIWSFSGVREWRDNIKSCFLAVKQSLFHIETEKRAYLNEFDVRKPVVVSFSTKK